MWVGRTAENVAVLVSGPLLGLAARRLWGYLSNSPYEMIGWPLLGYGILCLGLVLAFALSHALIDPEGSDWSPRRTQDVMTACVVTLGVAAVAILVA